MLAAAALAVAAGAATAGAAPIGTVPTLSFGADSPTAFPTPGLDLFTRSDLGGATTGLDQIFTLTTTDSTSTTQLAGTTSTQGTPSFTPTGGYLLAGNVPAPDCHVYAIEPQVERRYTLPSSFEGIRALGGLSCKNSPAPSKMRSSYVKVCLQARREPAGLGQKLWWWLGGGFQDVECKDDDINTYPEYFRNEGTKNYFVDQSPVFPCIKKPTKTEQWRTSVTGSATSASGESRKYGPVQSESLTFDCR